MTDYLARPEEQEDALLEQAKCLEQALYALTAAGAEKIPQATADAGEDLGDHRGKGLFPVGERSRSDTQGLQLSVSQAWEERQKREDEPALLGQLKQMDRAWEQARGRMEPADNPGQLHAGTRKWAQAGWEEAARGSSGTAAVSGQGQSPYAAAQTRLPAPTGGEPTWAEQTDRAFRRDSRRYDGGFYLY